LHACQCATASLPLTVCRWYCHFDDDMYVNTPLLLSTLAMHDPIKEKVYIGRWPRPVKSLTVPRPSVYARNYPLAVRVCLLWCILS
jgi:hypothetical protein